MSETFQNILTTIGQQKKAIAEAGGAPVNITYFKIGDSNGAYYEPAVGQTDLVNIKYTADFVEGTESQIIINPAAENEVLYKCFIPADVGGFTVRELGLFDSDDDLILICKLPAQDKFALGSGLYQPLTFTPKMVFTNPNTQVVLTPTSQITATQTFVSEYVSQEMTDHIDDPNAHSSLFAEKAELAGDDVQIFKVADAAANNQAVNLGQTNKLKSNFVSYSVNSGNVDASGLPDLINKVSDTEISFKVGGAYPNMGITFPNGNHYIVSSIANISTGLTADGTYILIIEEGNLTKLSDDTYSAIATAVKSGYSVNIASIVPAKTANNGTTDGTGWTVTVSSEATGSEGYKAVDGSIAANNRWYSSENGVGYWKIAKDSGTFSCTTVKIRACEDYVDSAPKNFTIKDQNGNILSTQTNQIFTADEEKSYTISGIDISAIKIDITATAGNSSIAFKEVTLSLSIDYAGGSVTEDVILPTSPSDGDYHLLTNQKPLSPKKRVSGAWTDKQFLKLGQTTKTSGTIGLPLISYAFNGKYVSEGFTLSNTQFIKNSNIGTNKTNIKWTLECLTIDIGYSVGDIIEGQSLYFNPATPISLYKAVNTIGMTVFTGASALQLLRKDTAAGGNIVFARWSCKLHVERSF